MADKDTLAIRFTDENYSTQSEVAKALNTSLIDPLWRNIRNYRDRFNKVLPLSNVKNRSYTLCLTNNIVSGIKRIENRLTEASDRYNDFLKEHEGDKGFENDYLKKELGLIARFHSITINDIALDNIISFRNRNDAYSPISNYYNALISVRSHKYRSIDDSLIADYLSLVSGKNELTSFYRSRDLATNVTRYSQVINDYSNGVPVSLIENMMNSLFKFASDTSYTPLTRALTCYVYFNYIKPFDDYNEEIALLLLKHILYANNTFDEKMVSILPIEILLLEDKSTLTEIYKEVRNNRDMTYFVNASFRIFDRIIGEFFDDLIAYGNNLLAKAIVTPLNKESFKQEFPGVELYDEKEEEVEVEPEIEPEPAPIPAPVYPKTTYQPQETHLEEEKPQPVKVKKIRKRDEPQQVSIDAIKGSRYIYKDRHTEQEYDEMAAALLESDPYLRPAQAHFYVRHNTIGKYYTIAQYKKEEEVVYETARTSMDNLVARGYYQKEALKNKFVYTPLKKE